ncbi:MAG: helix-turn-helix domain-containing protein [Planctomycetes bacterium]|nr:helix-turn-helix domain-containing protein [Planctomycetota bacterium]
MTDTQDTADLKDKQVFTTGEAAKICKVSQQTIIRCFDSGRLHGFKVPGSRFRRIPRSELIRFMQHNDMDMSQLESGPLRVLVVGVSPAQSDPVIKEYAQERKVEICHADDAWTAGYITHAFKPNLVLLNPTSSGVEESAVQNTINSNPELVNTNVVTVVPTQQASGTSFGTSNHADAIKQAVQQLMSA